MPGMTTTFKTDAGNGLTSSALSRRRGVAARSRSAVDRFGRRPVMLGFALTIVTSFASARRDVDRRSHRCAHDWRWVRLSASSSGAPSSADYDRAARGLDDRLGHDGHGDRADDLAADRRRARQ